MLELKEQESVDRSRSSAMVNSHSETILGELKSKRFAQVFEFLAEKKKAMNMLDVVLGDSPRFSNLSGEIRKDVECAAVLLCHTVGLYAPPVSAAMLNDEEERTSALVLAHATAKQADAENADPERGIAAALVSAHEFAELMHVVVNQLRGVPRKYLLPDTHVRHEQEELPFRPCINGRSAELAKGRWKDTNGPVYHQLHQHAKAVQVRSPSGYTVEECGLPRIDATRPWCAGAQGAAAAGEGARRALRVHLPSLPCQPAARRQWQGDQDGVLAACPSRRPRRTRWKPVRLLRPAGGHRGGPL